jgi:glucan phosphorylase
MKPYLMKIITVMVVALTMYASILLLDKGITNNADEITTLNRKITSLEAINLELESDINNLNMIMKGLRGALNDREINVDIKVQEAVDNKWKEQSATGGLGVLTGDNAHLEENTDG